jgi:hypothetical protein
MVLVLVAGLVTWFTIAGDDAPSPDRAPFYLAVYNLAALPVVDYSGAAPGGMSWNLDVTRAGETLGEVTLAGQRVPVLKAGGKTYVKLPQDLLASLPSDVPQASVRGRWITGNASLTGLVPQGMTTPLNLATRLWADLRKATGYPAAGAAGVRVDGVPALGLAIPGGELYVSAGAPFRVLRIAPSARATTEGAPSAAAIPFSAGAAPHGGIVLDDSLAGPGEPGQTDIRVPTPSAVDQVFGSLIDETRTLASALNIGVSFNFNPTPTLACSDSQPGAQRRRLHELHRLAGRPGDRADQGTRAGAGRRGGRC